MVSMSKADSEVEAASDRMGIVIECKSGSSDRKTSNELQKYDFGEAKGVTHIILIELHN